MIGSFTNPCVGLVTSGHTPIQTFATLLDV
jgi:hypothetical protein